MVLGKVDIHIQSIKLDPYLIPYTKMNSKWIKDLNERPKIIKLLKGNMEEKFHDTRFSNDFLDVHSKGTGNKK